MLLIKAFLCKFLCQSLKLVIIYFELESTAPDLSTSCLFVRLDAPALFYFRVKTNQAS